MNLKYYDYITGDVIEFETDGFEFLTGCFSESELDEYVDEWVEDEEEYYNNKTFVEKVKWLLRNTDILYDHDDQAQVFYEDCALQDSIDAKNELKSMNQEWFKSR